DAGAREKRGGQTSNTGEAGAGRGLTAVRRAPRCAACPIGMAAMGATDPSSADEGASGKRSAQASAIEARRGETPSVARCAARQRGPAKPETHEIAETSVRKHDGTAKR